MQVGLEKLYTVPDRQPRKNSNWQFIRGAKSFVIRGAERNEQMMTE
jgi:hypothetical protein